MLKRNGEMFTKLGDSAGLLINNIIKKIIYNLIVSIFRSFLSVVGKRHHRGLTCEVISVLKILSGFQGKGLVCTSTRLPSRQNSNKTQQFHSHMEKICRAPG